MNDVRAILLNGGVTNVNDHRVEPQDSFFHPVGIMVHHTATAGPALAIIQHGREGLAGPLAHLNIPRANAVHVVTDGLAWHAGRGSKVVLRETQRDVKPTGTAASRNLADDTDGNPWYYGIEIDNDGVGQDYPQGQIAALVWSCAALCKFHRWSANRVIHHKEWTARKTDMSWPGPIRQMVGELL